MDVLVLTIELNENCCGFQNLARKTFRCICKIIYIHKEYSSKSRTWKVNVCTYRIGNAVRIFLRQNKTCNVLHVYRNTETRSCSHCCRGKAKRITYCECVFVAVSIQHAMRILHIVICGQYGYTVRYFSTLSHKRHDFRKILLNIRYVFWFSVQLLSETFLILRRTERDMITSVCWSSCKVPVILGRF